MLLAVAQVHPILRWDRRSSWPLRAQVEWGLGSVGATRRVSDFSPAGGHICCADDFSEQPRCFSSVTTRQQRPPGIPVRTRATVQVGAQSKAGLGDARQESASGIRSCWVFWFVFLFYQQTQKENHRLTPKC